MNTSYERGARSLKDHAQEAESAPSAIAPLVPSLDPNTAGTSLDSKQTENQLGSLDPTSATQNLSKVEEKRKEKEIVIEPTLMSPQMASELVAHSQHFRAPHQKHAIYPGGFPGQMPGAHLHAQDHNLNPHAAYQQFAAAARQSQFQRPAQFDFPVNAPQVGDGSVMDMSHVQGYPSGVPMNIPVGHLAQGGQIKPQPKRKRGGKNENLEDASGASGPPPTRKPRNARGAKGKKKGPGGEEQIEQSHEGDQAQQAHQYNEDDLALFDNGAPPLPPPDEYPVPQANGEYVPENEDDRNGSGAGRRVSTAVFECDIPGCGSTFTRKFNLNGHKRSHTEERPFPCTFKDCDKSFARKHDRNRHEQLHINAESRTPQHVCQGCHKSFSRTDALNRHLKSEAGAACKRIHAAAKAQQEAVANQVGANEMESQMQHNGGQMHHMPMDMSGMHMGPGHPQYAQNLGGMEMGPEHDLPPPPQTHQIHHLSPQAQQMYNAHPTSMPYPNQPGPHHGQMPGNAHHYAPNGGQVHPQQQMVQMHGHEEGGDKRLTSPHGSLQREAGEESGLEETAEREEEPERGV